MSEPFQTIFAVLGTVFDMFTTMLFYKTCFGRKNIRVKKFTFYLVYTLFYAFGLVLSQFGYMPAFYLIKSFVIMFGLTLLYDAKWTTRLFAALSYLTFGIIAELIDIEILCPVDKICRLPQEYTFKPVFRLVNAVKITHKGDPANLQSTADLPILIIWLSICT